jgi:hypothetical protein
MQDFALKTFNLLTQGLILLRAVRIIKAAWLCMGLDRYFVPLFNLLWKQAFGSAILSQLNLRQR